jgi:hypothetical protein
MAQVTLEQTQEAMDALKVDGLTPHGKLAYWNAALSVRNRLDHNCMQGLVMRTYVNRPLPVNRDELKVQLGACLPRTLNTLYEIEALWNVGVIHFNCGTTFESQSAWRDSMVAAIPGMGHKTVSFALHIYAPDTCKLLAIDVWHLRRLGVDATKGITRKQYLAYELELRKHCEALQVCESTGKEYAPIVLAACLWERQRQASIHHNQFHKVDGYANHSGISCYV